MSKNKNMKRDFKGFTVPRKLIQTIGTLDAVTVSAIRVGAPGISNTQIRRVFKRGYITRLKLEPSHAHELCVASQRGNLFGSDFDSGFIGFICEWCECKTLSIQEHHFPISAKDGGKNTVFICAACHADYHTMTDVGVVGLSYEMEKYFDCSDLDYFRFERF
jgi:hypothetical protein